ncbi:uncharacterized protein MONBRDRAFT_10032 [Monosiga brevicollis MX1]|uniref:Glycosyl transferase family 1 domain-containing protein n=1 Tax=Monosiga brevicollis TaxID=81824 RepID=A9V4Z8_MONBE|nr:uncharacterized protein MONBRDRAFT_10032 [Monosiga brevicollis MX1]EDQ87457.1 predicted protein [Monosiga brevicollis MX1]|eukprot:XP_001747717.1 hypothetical protein [Monosiga brevicollis MX1]
MPAFLKQYSSYEEELFMDRLSPDLPVLNLCHRHWKGIRQATTMQGLPTIMGTSMAFPRFLHRIESLIQTKQVQHVVMHGCIPHYKNALVHLKEQYPHVKLSIVYHGSFAQHVDSFADVQCVQSMFELYSADILHKIASVRASHDIDMQEMLGRPVARIANYPLLPTTFPVRFSAFDGKVHIAILAASTNWRKNMIVQLIAAACHMPDAVVHMSLPPRMPVPTYLDSCVGQVIPFSPSAHSITLDLMQRVDLCFYVTFSEGDPMVPMECASASVPTLVADVSDAYDLDLETRQQLVVPTPDSPYAVAAVAKAALKHYDSVLQSPEARARNVYMYEMERLDMWLADGLLASSGHLVNWYAKQYHLPAQKLLPTGLPWASILAHTGPRGTQDPSKSQRFMFYGRVAPVKGITTIVEAIRLLFEAHPTARFLFAGPDGFCPDHKFECIKDMLGKKHARRITFARPHPRDKLAQLVTDVRAAIFASHYETTVLAAHELYYQHVPLIVPAEAPLNEYFTERNAITYRPRDAHALKDAMLRALDDQSPEFRRAALTPDLEYTYDDSIYTNVRVPEVEVDEHHYARLLDRARELMETY